MTFFGMAVFTAIGTVVLAVFAVVTAWYARKAFRKQSQEVHDQAKMLQLQSDQLEEQRKINARQTEVLELQAEELRESLGERKREAQERRRAQASRVFVEENRHPYNRDDPDAIAPGPAWVSATVLNGSRDPIYRAQLRWHQGSAPYGDPNPEPVGTVMAASEVSKRREFPRNANLDVCGAALEFRDAAGVRWLRSADGDLDELA